ncbi:MAG: GH3 auxin-responsive promoter family protein [Candidatus Sericytochromatia bacterium]
MSFESVACSVKDRNQPESGCKTLLAWLTYPGVICLGVWLHLLLKPVLPLYWSTQLPVLLGALTILGLETWLPYQPLWRPQGRDYRQDLLFMLVVQILLPKALALLCGLTLLKGMAVLAPGLGRLWPHDWPLGLQMVLMLLIGDFGRYWLHRWSHTVPWLWRFHAVHHAPQILYWNNVSRFHPVDKALQFLFDALPFMLLGVSQDVFALYFVFYALTGFFQHCNLDLRLGWLNYLISGPELHRWHHSREVEESNRNYGNKVIVWDLLFGTRFLPADRSVGELGLVNRSYPQDFASELKMPFLPGSEQQDMLLPGWRQLLLNGLLHLRMQLPGASHSLRRLARDPARTQQKLLLQILRRNQSTDFGSRFGFGRIRSLEDYRREVPLQDYESLRPYIENQAHSGVAALTAERPVMYNLTSGTTGQPKYIPVLASDLAQLRRKQQHYARIAYAARPRAFAGKLLGIVSPAVEGHLATGQAYGSASGHVYQTMPALARAKYVLPAGIFALADYELKYWLILRLALAEPTISYLGSANPSTFNKLLELLELQHPALIAEIAEGRCRGLESLPAPLQKAIRRQLRPDPRRAAELGALFARDPRPDLRVIWPGLELISTWTGGSCRIALDALRTRIPAEVLVLELGYIASEFRGSIPVDANGQCLPTLDRNFFEFVEATDAESACPTFLGLEQLQPGRSYYVLITTPAGLYRYQMNDIVRVTGFFERTPCFEFVQKGKGVTNITGEKLYEAQLIDAVRQAERELGTQSGHYLALADEAAACYRLYVEFLPERAATPAAFARSVEQQLGVVNLEYRAKRASGRLGPLQVSLLKPGSYEAFKLYCLGQGQREGQFKIVALQYQKDFAFDLVPYILAGAAQSPAALTATRRPACKSAA